VGYNECTVQKTHWYHYINMQNIMLLQGCQQTEHHCIIRKLAAQELQATECYSCHISFTLFHRRISVYNGSNIKFCTHNKLCLLIHEM